MTPSSVHSTSHSCASVGASVPKALKLLNLILCIVFPTYRMMWYLVSRQFNTNFLDLNLSRFFFFFFTSPVSGSVYAYYGYCSSSVMAASKSSSHVLSSSSYQRASFFVYGFGQTSNRKIPKYIQRTNILTVHF